MKSVGGGGQKIYGVSIARGLHKEEDLAMWVINATGINIIALATGHHFGFDNNSTAAMLCLLQSQLIVRPQTTPWRNGQGSRSGQHDSSTHTITRNFRQGMQKWKKIAKNLLDHAYYLEVYSSLMT